MGSALQNASSDPAEVVARVAVDRRDRLLRVYRRRLRLEDLEDCYSQATLELLVRSRRAPFADPEHVKNALEQKFHSRINDRLRALGGRSGIEAAIANALPVDAPDGTMHEVEDRTAAVERKAMLRSEVRRLREVMSDLSLDQRLVLNCEINLGLEPGEFCERYGWSIEKFRKVAQRGRWRLRALVEEYQSGERCRRLEPDLLAFVARSGDDQQTARARMHLSNCASCARYVARLERAGRSVPAVFPPFALSGVLAALVRHAKRVAFAVRHPARGGGGAAAAGITGGSTAGLATVKTGVAVLCIASAAGGIAICQRAGVALPFGLTSHAAQIAAHEPTPARHAPPQYPTTAFRASALIAPSATAQRRADIAQIRREFGIHRAVAAAVSPPAAAPALPAQPPAAVSQEATEFGFER